MRREKIIIANLKCGGCGSTIKNKLAEIPGVHSVVVKLEEDAVIVEHNTPADRITITNTLRKLGYPEATEENGLLLKIKSYASCMVGRMDNKVHT